VGKNQPYILSQIAFAWGPPTINAPPLAILDRTKRWNSCWGNLLFSQPFLQLMDLFFGIIIIHGVIRLITPKTRGTFA
jgi:hypothetical protein